MIFNLNLSQFVDQRKIGTEDKEGNGIAVDMFFSPLHSHKYNNPIVFSFNFNTEIKFCTFFAKLREVCHPGRKKIYWSRSHFSFTHRSGNIVINH